MGEDSPRPLPRRRRRRRLRGAGSSVGASSCAGASGCAASGSSAPSWGWARCPRTSWSAGRVNAAVLPVPVCAEATTSRPSSTRGMACSWTGVGVVKPRASTPARICSLSPSSANEVVMAASMRHDGHTRHVRKKKRAGSSRSHRAIQRASPAMRQMVRIRRVAVLYKSRFVYTTCSYLTQECRFCRFLGEVCARLRVFEHIPRVTLAKMAILTRGVCGGTNANNHFTVPWQRYSTKVMSPSLRGAASGSGSAE